MTIEKRLFGYTKDGGKVDCYTLADGVLSVEILNYGGIIRSFVIQTTKGPRDVALGFDDVEGYETHTGYIGALIGRVANRIGGASFSLNE
jgi:aldose 1-epimerase